MSSYKDKLELRYAERSLQLYSATCSSGYVIGFMSDNQKMNYISLWECLLSHERFDLLPEYAKVCYIYIQSLDELPEDNYYL